MAGKGKSDSDRAPSGFTVDEIRPLYEALIKHSRTLEALDAAKAGRTAEIGLVVRSAGCFFFDADGEPMVDGFAPTVIRRGNWDDSTPEILTSADGKAEAGRDRKPKAGYVTACTVDLSAVDDPREFFLKLLHHFGPVSITPRFKPALWRSVPFISADAQTQTDELNRAYTGAGQTVCVIDMGCDFAHRNFRRADDTQKTRLKWLYVMQHAVSGTARTYEAAELDTFIASNSGPYQDYNPNDPSYHCIPPGEDGAHGTMVLDIAGGNGTGTGLIGVAPQADLCFVQVRISGGTGRRYIEGADVLTALAFATARVDAIPNMRAVFNVSLGSNDGPHDTIDHLLSEWNIAVNMLFKNKPDRALVVSAGNQNRADIHASGTLFASAPATPVPTVFDIFVPRNDRRPNGFKIWIDGKHSNHTQRIALVDFKGAPQGFAPVWQTTTGPQFKFYDDDGREAGVLRKEVRYGTKPNERLWFIEGRIDPALARPSQGATDRWEIWRIELTATGSVASPMRLDAWLERDDLDQASFRNPKLPQGVIANSMVDARITLSAAAAGIESAIVAGAASAATYLPGTPKEGLGLGGAMPFSSSGPTRDGLLRPDVLAPGEVVAGAKSCGDPIAGRTGYGKAETTAMSGTSMAAPHVAGLIALLMEKGPTAHPEEIRAKLIASARRTPAGGGMAWDPQRGFGCVDAIKLLQ